MSLKTKEKKIKELSGHILGFQESVGDHLSLMKQLYNLEKQKPWDTHYVYTKILNETLNRMQNGLREWEARDKDMTLLPYILNPFDIYRLINDSTKLCDSILKEQQANLFNGSSEIKACAHKLKKEMDELWSDKMLISPIDSDVNWLYFNPPDPQRYDALYSLERNTRKFVELVLSEINAQEQLVRA